MAITLADLVLRLMLDVPAQDGIPTAGQYQQAVIDAVADLGRRASVPRVATIAILSGTGGYALPVDFQSLVRLNASGVVYPQGAPQYAAANAYAGVYGRSDYTSYNPYDPADRWLYGGGWGWGEQVVILGDELIVSPTPGSDGDRQLVYMGGDALVVATYPTLTEDRAQVALLLSSALCLERLLSSPRADAIKLETGQDTSGRDMLDTTKRGGELRASALHLRERYLDAVSVLIRVRGLAL